jgi:hypothetical protein
MVPVSHGNGGIPVLNICHDIFLILIGNSFHFRTCALIAGGLIDT